MLKKIVLVLLFSWALVSALLVVYKNQKLINALSTNYKDKIQEMTDDYNAVKNFTSAGLSVGERNYVDWRNKPIPASITIGSGSKIIFDKFIVKGAGKEKTNDTVNEIVNKYIDSCDLDNRKNTCNVAIGYMSGYNITDNHHVIYLGAYTDGIDGESYVLRIGKQSDPHSVMIELSKDEWKDLYYAFKKIARNKFSEAEEHIK